MQAEVSEVGGDCFVAFVTSWIDIVSASDY